MSEPETETRADPSPPWLAERAYEPFEPVTVRGYTSAGGRLAFEAQAASEAAYAAQLGHAQQLLNMGLLARVDVVKGTGTDLLGCMIEHDPQERISRKLAELRLRERG